METRRQALRFERVETRRRRQAQAAAVRARKAAEHAKEVTERAMLIMVRRAVLCAAAAGGREASLEAVTTTLQRKRNPGTLMRRVELEEKNLQTKRKRPAETPALSRFTLRELELAIGALVSVRGEQPRALT